MNILDVIIATKKKEVSAKRSALPLNVLERSALFDRKPNSMKNALSRAGYGIIAEHKRRSPSKSVINDKVGLTEVITGYTLGGASAISILTDTAYFGGSLDDLVLARSCTHLPLLRKEFIIDPYQVYEARAYGADAILLIVAALDDRSLKILSTLAKELGLEVLLEIHDRSELDRALELDIEMMGVNNRDLRTFKVSLDNSLSLADDIPDNYVKISESGINDADSIRLLSRSGYKGFLMGEHFMKNPRPGVALQEFIDGLNE